MDGELRIFTLNPSISFFVHVDTPADAERLYSALVAGGEALMPLGTYPWSERYGWVKDRFGVWQVIAGRRPQGGATIAPCLMFTGAQPGRAAEAMRLYTGIFPGGHIDSGEHYAAGEGPQSDVKDGRFVVAGQDMVAMDSHIEHGFTFNEALSFQVMCENQEELDRYWGALAEGGEHGPCGWLKDRFGVSWQVVPAHLAKWLTGATFTASERTLEAAWHIVATLHREIATVLKKADARIWHAVPVWFIDGNPVVGYKSWPNRVTLLSWNGQAFNEPGLVAAGKLKAAQVHYGSADDIRVGELRRWLKNAGRDVWDYRALRAGCR